MKKVSPLQRKLSRMNSKNLLALITLGGMNKRDATIAATIIDRRFPYVPTLNSK